MKTHTKGRAKAKAKAKAKTKVNETAPAKQRQRQRQIALSLQKGIISRKKMHAIEKSTMQCMQKAIARTRQGTH